MSGERQVHARTRSERRALLVGYSMAIEMARHAGPEAARQELREMIESEERMAAARGQAFVLRTTAPRPPDEPLQPNWRQRVSRMATPWPGRAPAGWWLIHKHAFWVAVFAVLVAGLTAGFIVGVVVA